MRTKTRVSTIAPALLAAVLSAPAQAAADATPNAVLQWNAIVQQAIHNASAPRSAGTSQVLHATVMLAIYDAAVSVEGGYRPFTSSASPHPGADVRAAVATAAYVTARARVAVSQQPFLDTQYATFMAGIPETPAKAYGVDAGQRAAMGILVLRQNDNFTNIAIYECSTTPPAPGEYEPDSGCPAGPTSPQPVDMKVGRIKPFTYADPSAFRPAGADPLTSGSYVEDFEETRDYGRSDSTVRSAEQTDIAFFWSENPYVHWNRALTRLAASRGLSVLETARFLAMTHTAVADAVIAGFEAKYYYRAWRPRTAIPRADTDGNPDTDGDPTWTPLLMVNHPEYPSGHGFWSGALLDAVRAFFKTNKLTWTIETSKTAVPRLVQTERTYDHLNKVEQEIGNARIWGGLHWRHSVRHGAQIGRHVAAHVTRHFFQPE